VIELPLSATNTIGLNQIAKLLRLTLLWIHDKITSQVSRSI